MHRFARIVLIAAALGALPITAARPSAQKPSVDVMRVMDLGGSLGLVQYLAANAADQRDAGSLNTKVYLQAIDSLIADLDAIKGPDLIDQRVRILRMRVDIETGGAKRAETYPVSMQTVYAGLIVKFQDIGDWVWYLDLGKNLERLQRATITSQDLADLSGIDLDKELNDCLQLIKKANAEAPKDAPPAFLKELRSVLALSKKSYSAKDRSTLGEAVFSASTSHARDSAKSEPQRDAGPKPPAPPSPPPPAFVPPAPAVSAAPTKPVAPPFSAPEKPATYATQFCGALESGQTSTARAIWLLDSSVMTTRCGRSAPLVIALDAQNSAMFEFLVNAGADIEMGTPLGATPLYVAAFHSNVQAVALLLSKGAKVDAVSSEMGATPLGIGYTNAEVVRLLLEKGANPDAKDKFGKTALDHAKALLAISLDDPVQAADLRKVIALLQKRTLRRGWH